MRVPRWALAALFQRQRRIRARVIYDVQQRIREDQARVLQLQQEVAILDAAINAALEDGVNLLEEDPL